MQIHAAVREAALALKIGRRSGFESFKEFPGRHPPDTIANW